jgi:hypothetical protein
MIRIASAALVAVALSVPAMADEVHDAAEAFINNPVQQKLLDDMLSPEVAMAQLQAMAPQMPPEVAQRVLVIVVEEMNVFRPEMEAAMISAAAESFTIDEIQALNDFYSSPLGASAMGKMTPYMQSAMATMGPGMQEMQGRIMQRVQEELQ